MRLYAAVATVTLLLSSAVMAENPACTAQIPARTEFTAKVSNTLKSETAKVGDQIELVVLDDVLSSGGNVLIAHGTKLTAHVVDAAPFQKESPARLSLRVSGINCKPDVRPLNAYLSGIPEVQTLINTGSKLGRDSMRDFSTMTQAEQRRRDCAFSPTTCGTGRNSSTRKMTNIDIKEADDLKVGTVLFNNKGNIKLGSGVILLLRSL